MSKLPKFGGLSSGLPAPQVSSIPPPLNGNGIKPPTQLGASSAIPTPFGHGRRTSAISRPGEDPLQATSPPNLNPSPLASKLAPPLKMKKSTSEGSDKAPTPPNNGRATIPPPPIRNSTAIATTKPNFAARTIKPVEQPLKINTANINNSIPAPPLSRGKNNSSPPMPPPSSRRVSIASRNSLQLTSEFIVGERIRVDSMNLEGMLRFLGPINIKPGIWAGVELDVVGTGKNDGSVGGVSYFTCAPKTGIFVLASKISKLSGSTISQTPQEQEEEEENYPLPLKTPLSSRSIRPKTTGALFDSSPAEPLTSPKPLQFQPNSRASRFTNMTAQQYKRASLMGLQPSMQQALENAIASGQVPMTPPASNVKRVSLGPLSPSDTVMMHARRVSLVDPEEYAKIKARLEVIEAENRLLKVRDQQQQAQLAASEMLDRGVVVEAQAALESSGEIAALRDRVEVLEKERAQLEAEKADLERELNEIKGRRASLMSSGLGDEDEQVLRLTELLQEREKRIRALEEELKQAKELQQRVKDLEDALAETDQALVAKENIEKELREALTKSSKQPSSNSSSNAEVERLRRTVQELEEQLESKSMEMGKLSARLDRSSTEHEKEKTILQETVSQLRQAGQETIKLYEDKMRKMEAEFYAMRDDPVVSTEQGNNLHEKRELADRIKTLESERERLIRAGQETIEVYELRVKQLKDEVDRTRTEIVAGGGLKDGLRLQLEAAKAELEIIKEAAARNELVRTNLEQELHNVRLESARLAADAAEAIEIGERASEELDKLRQEKEQALKDLVEAKERETTAISQVRNIQRSSQDSLAEVQSKQLALLALQDQVAMLEREKGGLKEELAALRIAQNKLDEAALQEERAEKEKLLEERNELRISLNEVKNDLQMALEGQKALEQKLQDTENALQVLTDTSPNYKGNFAEKDKFEEEIAALKQVSEARLKEKALENNQLRDSYEKLKEEQRSLENEMMKLMEEIEMLHSERLESTTVTATEDDPLLYDGQEAVTPERQKMLENQLQSFRDEVRRLQQRVAELEREKLVEIESREKDIADLESLVESKIFREADLEEQVEREMKRVKDLESQLERLRGSGAAIGVGPTVHSRKSSIEKLYCEICEIAGHDIMTCPAVMGVEGSGAASMGGGGKPAAVVSRATADIRPLTAFSQEEEEDDEEAYDRPYCENCEEFGSHWTEDCPNGDETF